MRAWIAMKIVALKIARVAQVFRSFRSFRIFLYSYNLISPCFFALLVLALGIVRVEGTSFLAGRAGFCRSTTGSNPDGERFLRPMSDK